MTVPIGSGERKPAAPQMAWRTNRRMTVPSYPAQQPGADYGEVEELHQLEEDILASAEADDPDPSHDDKHWQNRIMAVAAFKTAGVRRRAFEDEILSSVCESVSRRSTETGLMAMSSGTLTGGGRRGTAGHEGGGGGGMLGSGGFFAAVAPRVSGAGTTPPLPTDCGIVSLTACSSFKSLGYLSREDEDEMNSIMGTVDGQAPVPAPMPMRAFAVLEEF